MVVASGLSPRPGLPPFLVDGEVRTAGVMISQVFPALLILAWVLSSVALTIAHRRAYVVPWLAILAGTWAFTWLVWNFAPVLAPILIGLLLLVLNLVAIYGARRTILDRRAQQFIQPYDDTLRHRGLFMRHRHVITAIFSAAGIALMGVVIAAPMIGRLVAAEPYGTIRTIAVNGPPEVDDGMVVVDQGAARACILLRSNYIQWPDTRVTSGTVLILDSKNGTLVQTLPLDFYPGRIVVTGYAGRAFINAVSTFGIDTAINILHVLDMRSGTITQAIPAGKYLIDVAADARSHRIFAADWDESTVHVLNADTGVVLRTIRVGVHPENVVVAERASHVFVDSQGDEAHAAFMSVLDARTGTLVRTAQTNPWYLQNPGDLFATDEQTGRIFGVSGSTVSMRDAQIGVPLALVKVPGGQTDALAISQGTDHVFVVNSDHGSVSMLDGRRGMVLRTVRVGIHPTALAVDEHTQRVFVVNRDDGTVSVLSATTGQVLGTLRVGITPIAIGIDARHGRAFVYNATSMTVSVLDTRLNL